MASTTGPLAHPTSFVGSAQPTQPVMLMVQPPPKRSNQERYGKHFQGSLVTSLSISIIVCFFIGLIAQVVIFAISYYTIGDSGVGIWGGIFYAFTGAFGLLSVKKPSLCSIVTLMVFSILSACMSVPYLTMSSIGINERYRSTAGLKVAFGIQVICSLTGGILGIILSAIACRATCCKSSDHGASATYYATQAIPVQNLQPSTVVQMPSGSHVAEAVPMAGQEPQTPEANALPPKYDDLKDRSETPEDGKYHPFE